MTWVLVKDDSILFFWWTGPLSLFVYLYVHCMYSTQCWLCGCFRLWWSQTEGQCFCLYKSQRFSLWGLLWVRGNEPMCWMLRYVSEGWLCSWGIKTEHHSQLYVQQMPVRNWERAVRCIWVTQQGGLAAVCPLLARVESLGEFVSFWCLKGQEIKVNHASSCIR